MPIALELDPASLFHLRSGGHVLGLSEGQRLLRHRRAQLGAQQQPARQPFPVSGVGRRTPSRRVMPTLAASLNEQVPVVSGDRDVCSARIRKSLTLRISALSCGIASIAEPQTGVALLLRRAFPLLAEIGLGCNHVVSARFGLQTTSYALPVHVPAHPLLNRASRAKRNQTYVPAYMDSLGV